MLDTSKAVTGISYNGASMEINADYVRPADWLPIPETDSSKDEVYILQGVTEGDCNPLYVYVYGTATIDWGDGTIQNVSGYNTYRHQYNYDDLPASSWTEHNQTRQALVHITATRGAIQNCNIAVSDYYYFNSKGQSVKLPYERGTFIYEYYVDIQLGRTTISPTSSSGTKMNHTRLEKVTIKNSNFSDVRNLFRGCSSLQYIKELNGNLGNTESAFLGCAKIKKLPSMTFTNARHYGTFSGCSSLELKGNIDLGTYNDSGNYFNGCQSIKELESVRFGTGSSAFTNCANLKKVKKIIWGNPSCDGIFNNCYSLETFNLPSTKNVTSFYNAFYNCASIKKVELDLSSVTNVNNMFYNVSTLKSVKLYNLNPSGTSAISIDLSKNISLLENELLELFNSLPTSPAGTRTITLGSTLKGNLNNLYVKDSGEYYTIILPTTDTEIVTGKTYYTYDSDTDTYTEVTPDFSMAEIYYEEYTATWNKYVICESTDTGAELALSWIANKGYTIS